MRIEVGRFKDGRLKLIVHHEENSYFWKSSLSECPRMEDEKLRIESLLMFDWWNGQYHEEFENLWKYLRSFFLDKYKRRK